MQRQSKDKALFHHRQQHHHHQTHRRHHQQFPKPKEKVRAIHCKSN